MKSPLLLPLIHLTLCTILGAAQGDPPLPPERTGLLYLSGNAQNQINECLPDGTVLRSITNASMSSPRGVNVDDFGNLVVVCQGSDQIQVIDLNGQLLGAVTHPDLTDGTGIARSADGSWYVGNFSPGRVLEFDADWNYQSTLTESGMNGVNCVSFDFAGNFAVSSAFSNKIYLFDAAHQPIGTATHSSIGSPMSIAMDSTGNHFVSNGSTGVITQFDSSWAYVRQFGSGVLNAQQGVAIDENDLLTITNYSGGLVHRYDNQGNLLGSFPATGLVRPRNLTWQTSKVQLAREGGVASTLGRPQVVLAVNGSTGDAHGRIQVGASDALTVHLDTSSAGPNPAPFVLYAWIGESGPNMIEEIPQIDGLICGPLAPQMNVGYTLVNSIGLTNQLGTGTFPAVNAPADALSLPNGLGVVGTFTLQAILADDAAATAPKTPYSATNALVIQFQ